MVKIATDLYEKDKIIQEEDDKYIEVSDKQVVFGENQEYGIGYRSSWGMVTIKKKKIQSPSDFI